MKGTKFQLQVWNYLKKIPKGSVKTYKQVAIAINKPKSARAVANACAANPYAPNIPCLLYTSPSPRDATLSRMPSSA